MKTLQECKDEVERGWPTTINDLIMRDQKISVDEIIDGVAKLYAQQFKDEISKLKHDKEELKLLLNSISISNYAILSPEIRNRITEVLIKQVTTEK